MMMRLFPILFAALSSSSTGRGGASAFTPRITSSSSTTGVSVARPTRSSWMLVVFESYGDVLSNKNLTNPFEVPKKDSNKHMPTKAVEVYSKGCPFHARRGYVDARADYLLHFHGVVEKRGTGTNDESIPTKSLVASTNLNDPLYFWQLYSLIGTEPILDLVTGFYERVFDDTQNARFRDVFVAIAPLGHHINTQAAYWVDAFGGGKYYHGGNHRVNFHHAHNAREVMNAKGAERWMHHMTNALIAAKDESVFQKDPRILPCIVDFLDAKMRTYAHQNSWDFDASDFSKLREVFGQTKEVKSKS